MVTTFPQDGDKDSAEFFSLWTARSNISNYVETGITFDVDYANNTFDLTAGRAYIKDGREDKVIEIESTDIQGEPLTDNAVNYIFLQSDFGQNDNVSVEVNTTNSSPSLPSLKIGEIDTGSDTDSLINREPVVRARKIVADSIDSGGTSHSDDERVVFGSDDDFSVRYDSSTDSLTFADENSSNDVLDISPNGNVDVERGVLSEQGTGVLLADGSRTLNGSLTVTGDITDGSLTIYDSSNEYLLQNRLENDSLTINANDNLTGGGTVALGSSLDITASASALSGTFLSGDGSNNITVDIGRGVENDGSGNIRVDEDTDFTFTSAIDFSSGLDASANITDGSTVIWNSSAGYVPQSQLGGPASSLSAYPLANSDISNSSVTVTAGDGLGDGGSVSLGSSVSLSVNPAELAGAYLSEDGSNDFQVNIGRGIEGDGSDNIQVDEDTDFTFTSAIDFSSGLDTSANITDGSTVIWNSSAGYVPQSQLGGPASSLSAYPLTNSDISNSSVTVTAADGLDDGGSVSLGSSVSLSVNPAELAGAYLSENGSNDFQVNLGEGLEGDGSDNIRVDEDEDFTFTSAIDFNNGLDTSANITDNGTIIWNSSAGYVPQSQLGGPASSLSAYPLANSDISNSSVTVTAGDGLNDGGSVSLGSSVSLSVNPTELAGPYLSENGSNDFQVNLGEGLEGDGSDNIQVDEDTDFTFTSAIDFNAGLDVSGDITDGSTVIWDSSASEVPQSSLSNSSITITAGTGIESAGTVSLGGSVTIDVDDDRYILESGDTMSGALGMGTNPINGTGSTQLNFTATGLDLHTDGSGSGDITIKDSANSNDIAVFSEGGDVSVSAGSFSVDGQTVYDASTDEIPDSAMGSIANSTLTNSSVTVTAGNALTGGGTASLGSSVTIDVGTIQNSDLANDSVTVAGNLVSLGGSTSVNHNDLSTISSDDHHTRYSDEEAQDAIGTILNTDFTYDDSGNAISLSNNSVTVTAGNALTGGGTITLGGSTTIDVGTIQNSDLNNSSVTVAGNNVSLGGSTSVNHNDLSTISSDDHHTRYSDEEAQDAIGTILNTDFTYDDSGNTISLSNTSVTVNSGTSLSGGGNVSLGGSITLNVDDDFVENTGDGISGSLNFTNSSPIQDSGTNAINFDGSANVNFPNGNVTIAGKLTENASL